MLVDSQGLIALFWVKLDRRQNRITARAGLYQSTVDADPDLNYLFVCPEFKVIVRLDSQHVYPGNLYIQEEGESLIIHPIVRITPYESFLEYQMYNPRNV